MARGPKKKQDEPIEEVQVVGKMDAERAKKIILKDIIPERTKVGEHSQAISTAFKEISKHCNIPSWVVRTVMKLRDLEDAKQEHELRALSAMLSAFNLGVIAPDLVDQANGSNGTNVIPMRKGDDAPGLIPLGDDDFDDDTFAEAADEDPADLKLAN